MIHVFILTFCQNLENFYGSELIFKTLRVGFPNAKVTVVDNASISEAQNKIEFLSKKNECEFEKIENPGISHHEFIEGTIRKMALYNDSNWPLVFIDPDVCLWRSCEDFTFKGMMAGKFCGESSNHI